MERKTFDIHQKRTLNTFALLSQTARHSMDNGRSGRDGSTLDWMTAGVFAAFSLEAFFNHVGAKRFRHWERFERGLRVEDKLELILDELGQKPDWGARPFQTIGSIFKFRHALAHARTVELDHRSTQVVEDRHEVPELTVWWEDQCNETTMKRMVDDSWAVIETIAEWAGVDCSLGSGEIFMQLRRGPL